MTGLKLKLKFLLRRSLLAQMLLINENLKPKHVIGSKRGDEEQRMRVGVLS